MFVDIFFKTIQYMYKYVQQVPLIRIQMDKRYYLYIVGGFDASLSVRHCAP